MTTDSATTGGAGEEVLPADWLDNLTLVVHYSQRFGASLRTATKHFSPGCSWFTEVARFFGEKYCTTETSSGFVRDQVCDWYSSWNEKIAARLAAAYNACHGVPTSSLKPGIVHELQTEKARLVAEVERLKAQVGEDEILMDIALSYIDQSSAVGSKLVLEIRERLRPERCVNDFFKQQRDGVILESGGG